MHDCVYGYGVMRVIVRNPEFSQDFALGDQGTQPNIENTVKKCDFCSHRVDKGEEPFCVTQCPARARYFGNIEDTGSKPALLLSRRVHSSIPPEQVVTGVEQFFYFLKP
jgi:molybdopterin-containing oxidoreductase family iron-sulfur binding subunit